MQEAEYHAMAALEARHWWYRSLHSRVLRRLEAEARHRGQPLEVFDAGCGTGGLLVALKGQPWIASASGCDTHPLALHYTRSRGLSVADVSVNDLNGWPGRFDVVMSIDVLYHRQVKPAAAIAGMASLLRPGGLLLLNAAAMPCLRREHDRRVMGGRRFLPGPLRQLVQEAGLDVEELRYWNSWLTPLLWLQSRLERLGSRHRPPAGPDGSHGAEPGTRVTIEDDSHKGSQHDSDVKLPPAWLNRMLVLVLRLEDRCSAPLPLPWGSSLLLRARRPGAAESPGSDHEHPDHDRVS